MKLVNFVTLRWINHYNIIMKYIISETSLIQKMILNHINTFINYIIIMSAHKPWL